MLGALVFVCLNGGYVMRSSFRRVYHACCLGCVYIGSPRVVLSLKVSSAPFIDRHLVFSFFLFYKLFSAQARRPAFY